MAKSEVRLPNGTIRQTGEYDVAGPPAGRPAARPGSARRAPCSTPGTPRPGRAGAARGALPAGKGACRGRWLASLAAGEAAAVANTRPTRRGGPAASGTNLARRLQGKTGGPVAHLVKAIAARTLFNAGEAITGLSTLHRLATTSSSRGLAPPPVL
ncbi:hypothetical protein SSTU70S_05908 [Stutzerimonas stutzeri]